VTSLTRVSGDLVQKVEAAARQMGAPPLRLCAIVLAGHDEPIVVPRDYVRELRDLAGREVTPTLRELLLATAAGADDALKIIFVMPDGASIDVVNLPATVLSHATARSSVELTAPLPAPGSPARDPW
jgi:hypothetical protein